MITNILLALNLIFAIGTYLYIYLFLKHKKPEPIIERAISTTKKIIKSAHGTFVIESKHDPVVYDEEAQYKDEMQRKGILD